MGLDLAILLAYILDYSSLLLLFGFGDDEIWLADFKRIHLRRLNHKERLIEFQLLLVFEFFDDEIAYFWKLVAAGDFGYDVGELHIDVNLMS